ncbi:MAG: hypothetical protein IJR58_08215, partial [Lachnospiraceae bacterium]|nr:hypothetical protein [Lachnospiraceae bacterium]
HHGKLLTFGPVPFVTCAQRVTVPVPLTHLWRGSKIEFIYCALVLFYVVLLLANDTYNPFIYFRF